MTTKYVASQHRQMDSAGNIRYGLDMCKCGHPWRDHYSPRPGAHAGCWNTDNGRLDNCGNFVFTPSVGG